MIKIIGFKRLIILVVFLLINAFLAFLIYGYLVPQQEVKDRRERSLRSQVSSVQSDIDRVQLEFEQIDRQQDEFDVLKEQGFFSVQSRNDAKKMFSEFQDRSNVISAVVSVKPGVAVDDEDASKANHKLLVSPINIDIEAFDDGDVYRYISLLENEFPGHISLDSLEMTRVRDVNAAVLRAISSGANPVMIKAKIILSWRTMVPESQITGDIQ